MGFGRALILAIGVMGFGSVCAAAQTEAVLGDVAEVRASDQGMVPLQVYGGEPRVDFITLSPNGAWVGRVETIDGHRILIVSNLADNSIVFAKRIGEAKVRGLSFIDEDRLLILTSQTRSLAAIGGGRTELSVGHILDLKTQKVAVVLDKTDGVLTSPYGPVEVRHTAAGPLVLTRGYNVVSGNADLYRIDLSNGRGQLVRRMTVDVESVVTDAEGEVVAMSEYNERTGRWILKLLQSGWMKDSWATTAPLDAPQLIGLGRRADTVLVSAQRPDLASNSDSSEDGYQYFEVAIQTGEWTRLEYHEYPRGLVYHPRSKLLIGFMQTDEIGFRYTFFDELAARRWQAIERAFPTEYPALANWSHDMGSILIFIDRGDSGHYQLVDFEAGRADIAGELFPDLPPERVGLVRHLTYKASDGLEIPAYMTLPPGVTDPHNLPLVVLPHGGPAARDGAGFDYWAQAVASRGYVVLQPNFRGSTGYGREFLEAGYGEWGRKMQSDLSDGVRHLAAEGVIDPARVCIMGASYGGYAAMAGLALDGDVYRCGVAVSGVSDLRRMLRWTANTRGSRNNSSIRYWTRFMGADGVGDRDLDAYSPAMQAARVKAPLLLIHGKDDTVVPIEQSRIMVSAMREANKPVEFVELNGEDHWLSRSETRIRMLEEAVRFLETHNPPH